MQKERYLILIEYAKESDKGVDGFRPDTKVIQKAIEHHAQCEGEIVFYTHKKTGASQRVYSQTRSTQRGAYY